MKIITSENYTERKWNNMDPSLRYEILCQMGVDTLMSRKLCDSSWKNLSNDTKRHFTVYVNMKPL